MRRGKIPGVVKQNFIRGRVVQSGDENCLCRNLNSLFLEAIAYPGLVQNRRCHPRIRIACVATTRTAVERRSIRVVRRRASVTANQDYFGKMRDQAHVLQCAGGQRNLVGQYDAGF